MVDSWTVSDDKLTCSFTLRDGLKWHDGSRCAPADCVASIERWGKRDPFGQKLMEAVAEITADDDKTFTISAQIAVPADARRARQTVEQCAVHDARAARQDRRRSSKSPRRSAPARSNSSRRNGSPAHKAVFVKNTDYVPRKEPPSFAAGGKVAKVDRVEWLYIPDSATAAGGAQCRRGRLVRAAAGRPACRSSPPTSRRHGHHRRPARQYRRPALQPHCCRRSTI